MISRILMFAGWEILRSPMAGVDPRGLGKKRRTRRDSEARVTAVLAKGFGCRPDAAHSSADSLRQENGREFLRIRLPRLTPSG
jgi:hypothetical protein